MMFGSDGGRYRIRTYDFHRVKLTSLGKSRIYGERSGTLRTYSKDLEQPENNKWCLIWSQKTSERLASVYSTNQQPVEFFREASHNAR
jgi:hypothetical protein